MPHPVRPGGARVALAALLVAAFTTTALAKDAKDRSYALASPPLAIYDRLSSLKMGAVPRLSEDERKLLAKIWEMRGKKPAAAVKVEEARLLDAMLFASGIEKADGRRKYRKQYEELVTNARKAVKSAKNDRERGERLMKFLHTGVMKKGYQSEQTSLAVVFDTGKFNCVSATALYYLVGTRLGLKLRVISIPGTSYSAGHAALDLVDGTRRIQVEPTSPDGFDWQAKIKRPGVVVVSGLPDRKTGREVEAPGIAAMIYSNRGVGLSKAKPAKRIEAVRCYLAALALDPADETATNNLLAIFVNWGPELMAQKRFEDAIRVLAFGLRASPKSDALRNNHHVAWSRYILATLESGKDKDALALITRAAKAIPDKDDFKSPSGWYARHGQERRRQKGWEAALAVAERGLKVLSADEAKKLRAWRTTVFRLWSQSCLDKKDIEGSMKVLARAYALDDKDKEVLAGIEYHTQTALPLAETASGLAGLVKHYEALRKRFPKVDAVAERGEAHAERAISQLADAKKFKEAVKAVDQYRALLPKPEQRAKAGGIAYDRWARHLSGNKDWKGALDKYAEGLKAYPKHERLTGNAIATVDEWASPAIEKKNWDEAIRIYDQGLEYFKDNKHLTHNKDYCKRMKEKA